MGHDAERAAEFQGWAAKARAAGQEEVGVQIVLAFLLHQQGLEILQWTGRICTWISGLSGGLPIMALRQKEDLYCFDGFGDAYRRYMEGVRRVNCAAGVTRLRRRRAERGKEIRR